MSNELLDIFHEELIPDRLLLRQYIDEAAWSSVGDFAHKYKVRLQYLGYLTLYDLCVQIETIFKSGATAPLQSLAEKLYDGLKACRPINN